MDKIKQEDVKTQRDAILWHLQNYGSITSWQAIKNYGVTRLAAIVSELKKRGHNIDSEKMVQRNRFNHKVTFSKYVYPDFNENNQSITNNKSLI